MSAENTRKKLIEVALPLDAINKASAREKSIRHGHPSTLHLWWARRPLAAARAVIFAQMVDDPSGYVDVLLSDPKKRRAAERELKKRLAEHAAKQALADDDAIAEPEPTLAEVVAEIERDRLFAILEDLVLWENTTFDPVLQRARDEIWQSWRRACEARREWRGVRSENAPLSPHSSDLTPLSQGGTGATAYAEAVGVYLACGISRSADFWSSLCVWANQPKNELVAHLFGRQAIPMAWDFAEANPFSESGGNFSKNLSYVAMGIDYLAGSAPGHALQLDAATNSASADKVVSTDPLYYDNIGYADLSDYFYVWLRRSLKPVFPELFATLAVPKAEELV